MAWIPHTTAEAVTAIQGQAEGRCKLPAHEFSSSIWSLIKAEWKFTPFGNNFVYIFWE